MARINPLDVVARAYRKWLWTQPRFVRVTLSVVGKILLPLWWIAYFLIGALVAPLLPGVLVIGGLALFGYLADRFVAPRFGLEGFEWKSVIFGAILGVTLTWLYRSQDQPSEKHEL